MSDDTFAFGWLGPEETQNDFTKMLFLLTQTLARVRTAMLVQVKSCSNTGAVAAVGTVSVQPLVNMVDGMGNSLAHGEVFNLPYFRLQGSTTGAVIMDPVVGDIGVAVISDRDISAVKNSKAASNPSTYRQHDIADGLYFGSFLGAVPETYIQFDGQGNVTVNAKNAVNIKAPNGVAITGNVSVTGSITSTGDTKAGTISLENHVHSGVQTGGGDSGPPVP